MNILQDKMQILPGKQENNNNNNNNNNNGYF